jgi:glycerophosphoryl diester phosphodiesterase
VISGRLNRPLLLGHRGARAEKSIPENTLASFDFALAHGCDGFEFDVRLSADQQGVLCHDATYGKHRIADCSATQLALPLLSEVLRRYQNSAFLDIELKVPGLERIVADLLRIHPPAHGYVISSFIPKILLTLGAMNSSTPLGLICETPSQFAIWPSLPLECLILQHKLVRPAVLSKLKIAGKKVFVWTVNSPREIRKFRQWEVDAIISDYPQRLANQELSRR